MPRGGDSGGDFATNGMGTVRAVQRHYGHAMVPYRRLLLCHAPVLLLVLPVHECTHGERPVLFCFWSIGRFLWEAFVFRLQTVFSFASECIFAHDGY